MRYLIFFLCLSGLFAHEHKLAICAIFKNEGRFLKEWIEYHRLIGVDHFYLYDNESTDHSRLVLQPYVKEGIVEVNFWGKSSQAPWQNPSNPDPVHFPAWSGVNYLGHYCGYQVSAYNDCIGKCKGIARFLAAIDIDEYLVPARGVESLHALLDDPSLADVGSFQMNWRCFGTSFIRQIGSNQIMIEELTMKLFEEARMNVMHVKCIYRPEAVAHCHIHEAMLKPGYRSYLATTDGIRIHHYYLRDQKDCLEKRCGFKRDCLVSYESIFNQEEDQTILQYVPALRERMRLSQYSR